REHLHRALLRFRNSGSALDQSDKLGAPRAQFWLSAEFGDAVRSAHTNGKQRVRQERNDRLDELWANSARGQQRACENGVHQFVVRLSVVAVWPAGLQCRNLGLTPPQVRHLLNRLVAQPSSIRQTKQGSRAAMRAT